MYTYTHTHKHTYAYASKPGACIVTMAFDPLFIRVHPWIFTEILLDNRENTRVFSTLKMNEIEDNVAPLADWYALSS